MIRNNGEHSAIPEGYKEAAEKLLSLWRSHKADIMQKLKQDHIFLIFIVLIIICIFQYGIQKICGFTLYPDEFGYWASAANAVGYNWSEVASMGSYYSFGYSLILVPILKLFPDGVAAYRAAIAINMLLMCISVFLLREIAQKIFPEMDKAKRIFVSGIAVLYPPWIFYMQMTMAEALLCFLFVLISYLLLFFIEKPKVTTAIVIAVALVYIYSVHMRTAGVVIACFITWILWSFARKDNKKEKIIFIMVFAAAGLAAMGLKKNTILEVYTYAEQETLAWNDYASQWSKFKEILTVQGSIRLLENIIGKLFYLGISGFGIFYWAFGWCICESVSLMKRLVKRKGILLRHWAGLFLFLAVTGEILISSIYMYRPGNIDCLIYGRYNELLVPVMLLVGIAVMERNRFLIPVTLLLGMVTGGMLLFLLNVMEKRNLTGMRGYHIAGLSYLLKEEELNELLFFRNTWLLGFGVMLLVSVLIWLGRRWNNGWILTGILLLEIAMGIQISHHYTYRINHILYENQMIAETIRENSADSESVFYLDEGKGEFIDFLQMQLPEYSIHVLDGSIAEDKNAVLSKVEGFLITDADTEHEELLQEFFEKKATTNMFCLYFTPKE